MRPSEEAVRPPDSPEDFLIKSCLHNICTNIKDRKGCLPRSAAGGSFCQAVFMDFLTAAFLRSSFLQALRRVTRGRCMHFSENCRKYKQTMLGQEESHEVKYDQVRGAVNGLRVPKRTPGPDPAGQVRKNTIRTPGSSRIRSQAAKEKRRQIWTSSSGTLIIFISASY